MTPPRVHIVGRQNQGKTTLVVELARFLTGAGVRVGTIKHTGHDHPVDRAGKDSFRHREAGGAPAAFATPAEVGVYMDRQDDVYAQLAPLYGGCDVVLVEGNLDAQGVAKLEIFRAGQGHPAPLALERDDISAVISDDELPGVATRCPRGDMPRAARLVLDLAGLERDVWGCVLAGGQSRRFGSDKARAAIQGEALIQHVARQLPPQVGGPWVVAREADQYADLGLETIGDEAPDLGPTGGLVTALAAMPSGCQWALLLPCDMWGLKRDWLVRLLEARADGVRAVAHRDTRWQPLPGLYHRDLLPDVRRVLGQQGTAPLWRVLEESPGVVALPTPDGWEEAVGVNSRADLERVRPPARR